jgi:hypothetical protein
MSFNQPNVKIVQQLDLIRNLSFEENYKAAFCEFKNLFHLYAVDKNVVDLSTLLSDCHKLASAVPHAEKGREFAKELVIFVAQSIRDYCETIGSAVHCSLFTKYLNFINSFNYEEIFCKETNRTTWAPIHSGSGKTEWDLLEFYEIACSLIPDYCEVDDEEKAKSIIEKVRSLLGKDHKITKKVEESLNEI